MELQSLDPQQIIAAGQRTMLVFGGFVLAFVVVIGWAMLRFFRGGWRRVRHGDLSDVGGPDWYLHDGGHGSGGDAGGDGADGGH